MHADLTQAGDTRATSRRRHPAATGTILLVALLAGGLLPGCTTEQPGTEPQSTSAYTYETMTLPGPTTLRYALVLPDGFRREQTYPVVLALPPGPQTEAMVELALDGYWAAEARRRGWVVASPIAADAALLFEGSPFTLDDVVKALGERVRIEAGKVFLTGISNGGLSGFRAALRAPGALRALLVAPGMPPTDREQEELPTLAHVPVLLFVGEHDSPWRQRMQATEQALLRAGGTVTLTVLPGEGHVLESLRGGERFFDALDAVRRSAQKAP